MGKDYYPQVLLEKFKYMCEFTNDEVKVFLMSLMKKILMIMNAHKSMH